jgi:hypothetical protein
MPVGADFKTRGATARQHRFILQSDLPVQPLARSNFTPDPGLHKKPEGPLPDQIPQGSS